MSDTTLEPLVALGFTSLEAEVYTWLLQESPVTGYRIAQALRKPAPNVYKALESLQAKGAVLVDEGESRQCRPVPPPELLAQLDRRFQRDRTEAARRLADLSGPSEDDRVYTLRSPEQVLERARRMLEHSREVAILDAFPLPLAALRPEIEATAARGVQVTAKVYAPIELEGVRIVEDARTDVFERWPGQWINLVSDGREHLVALLTADGRAVHQAVWSGSVYLSWVYHSALGSEIALDAVRAALAAGAEAGQVTDLIAEMDSVKALHAPGYRELSRRVNEERTS